MDKRLITEVNELLKEKIIDNIEFIRGFGIVPAKFVITISDQGSKFVIEAETNFRILLHGKNLLSFDDLYLKNNFCEITPLEYEKQKNIENTLLNLRLQAAINEFVGKKISRVIFMPFGDVNIAINRFGVFNFLNDSHLEDGVIFKLICKDNNKEICKLITKQGDLILSN